jgi:hypothetical protein
VFDPERTSRSGKKKRSGKSSSNYRKTCFPRDETVDSESKRRQMTLTTSLGRERGRERKREREREERDRDREREGKRG